MRKWLTHNKLPLLLGVVAVFFVGAACVFFIGKQSDSASCKPLDEDTTKLVEQKKVKEAAGDVKAVSCKAPSPQSYKSLDAKQKTSQFNANFALAEQLYSDGKKDDAQKLANNSLSAYQSMSQTEKEQMRGFVSKLVILNEIKAGTYEQN